MNYQTLLSIAFLSFCVFVDRCTPPSKRWIGLVIFSVLFLAANSFVSLLLLLLLIPLNFFGARALERPGAGRESPFIFPLLLGANLLPFLLYKYVPGNPLPLGTEAVIPLGISFYTFSNLSYLIDVRRGLAAAETHLGHFSVFSLFFPKLGAGPIERASPFLQQVKAAKATDPLQFREGVALLLLGLLKKLLLANTLALIVLPIFLDPGRFSPLTLLEATALARYYIYADFSGYTDMARGSAKMFGIDLGINFRTPFAAKSITEFWQRWHISLSTWIRDYVYFPLVSSRLSRLGNSLLIILSFLCLGLWHGATWPFVLYGLFHGLSVAGSIRSQRFRETLARATRIDRFPRLLGGWKIVSTFLFLVCLPTVLFMSPTIQGALLCYAKMARAFVGIAPFGKLDFQGDPGALHRTALLYIMVTEALGYANRRYSLLTRISRLPLGPRWVIYATLFAALLLSGASHSSPRFIYFQF